MGDFMLENLNFKIPDYVKDEIEIYLWKKEHKKSGIATFNNALALIGLARASKRITKEEAEQIKVLLYSLE